MVRASSSRTRLAALLSTLALPLLSDAALYEPDGNKVWLGFWPQTESPSYIHPNSLNPLFQIPNTGTTNLNVSIPIFQIAQQIPRPAYNYTTGAGGPAPEYLVEQTLTDAMVFLTVYPTTLEAVTTEDYNVLGNQILEYQTKFNRNVFLRWAPEMQGAWNPGYGQRPVEYINVWRVMYDSIKRIAPATAIVWAPNLGIGYPYGQTFTTIAETTQADRTALDTNNNGQLDDGDDPYMPYYPGDAYVDWIGLSVYYKGLTNGNQNNPQPAGYCTGVLAGSVDGSAAAADLNWYNRFCAQKPDKACMISESGAAWHVNNPPIVTQLQYQRTWWQDCITNQTYLDLHPRLRMIMHFEYEKEETDGGVTDLRDYRLTNSTEILAAFIQDLTTVQDRFQWASYRALPSAVPSAGRPTDISDGTTTAPLVFNTARNTHTSFPQLFGTVAGAPRSYELANILPISVALGAVVLSGLAGGLFVGRSRRSVKL